MTGEVGLYDTRRLGERCRRVPNLAYPPVLHFSAETDVEGTSVKRRPHLRDWGATQTRCRPYERVEASLSHIRQIDCIDKDRNGAKADFAAPLSSR